MLKLEEIQKNAAISGIEPGQVVRVVSWIKQQSMENLETSREQDGDATGQPNNGERK